MTRRHCTICGRKRDDRRLILIGDKWVCNNTVSSIDARINYYKNYKGLHVKIHCCKMEFFQMEFDKIQRQREIFKSFLSANPEMIDFFRLS